MHRLSQFPTPYPDECYYSILCRYYQRMGYSSFDRTMISLFGNTHHTDMFVLMPFLATYVNDWVEPDPKINADAITDNHTAFSYCVLSDWKWYPQGDVKKRMWDGTIKYHSGFISVKKDNLCYCPECAEEERKKYGEPYWHRLHQIREITVCEKHGTGIAESRVSIKMTKRAFFPASDVIPCYTEVITPPAGEYRQRIRLATDISWIVSNNKNLRNNTGVSELMKHYLMKKNVEINSGGYLKNADIELKSFVNYHIKWHDEDICRPEYFRETFGKEDVPLWIFDFFKPLDLVMLMEYLEGSAEKFYECF